MNVFTEEYVPLWGREKRKICLIQVVNAIFSFEMILQSALHNMFF